MEETIGSRVSELIKALGIKKVQFAKRINLDPSFVAHITAGRGNPSDRTVADICREFGVNEDWLRSGNGEMFVHTKEHVIDQLCSQLGLGEVEKEAMRLYLKLDPDIREPFVRDLFRVIKETYAEELQKKQEEFDIETEVERYRQELLLEKKMAGRSSVFPAESTA